MSSRISRLLLSLFPLMVFGCHGHALSDDSIHSTAGRGDLKSLRDMLDREPAMANSRGKYGQTPLMAAALAGNSDVAAELLARGARATDTDQFGLTARAMAMTTLKSFDAAWRESQMKHMRQQGVPEDKIKAWQAKIEAERTEDQRRGLLATISLLERAEARERVASELPVRAQGEITIEGAAIRFQTEYWGAECMMKGDVLTASGMHDAYYDVMRHINDASTMEEVRSLWVPESFKQLPEDMVRASLERNVQSREAGKQRPRRDQNIYMSVMTEYKGQKDLFIMVSAPVPKPDPEGFNIQSISFRDGQWKYSPLSLSDHPARKELQLGAWKQFGAPVDVGDPEGKRQILNRYLAATRSAATQAATSPSASRK